MGYQPPVSLLIRRGKAIKVPVAAKMLVPMKIIKAWIIRFLNHPLNEAISSLTFSKSFTLGLRIVTSKIPATIPTPIVGFKAVIGAANIETIMVTGWANVRIAAIPVREELRANQ